MTGHQYAVILVHSTSHAIRAEKLLHRAGVACKMIPVPRHLSSDCGVCLRLERTETAAAREVLQAAGMDLVGVHDI